MRLLNVFLDKLKPILLLLSLAGCVTERVVQEPVKVIHPDFPRPVQMQNVTFKVVTHKNLNQFVSEWKSVYGEDFAFLVLHIKDYEASVTNLEELRRYISQQREIIIYYRKAIP